MPTWDHRVLSQTVRRGVTARGVGEGLGPAAMMRPRPAPRLVINLTPLLGQALLHAARRPRRSGGARGCVYQTSRIWGPPASLALGLRTGPVDSAPGNIHCGRRRRLRFARAAPPSASLCAAQLLPILCWRTSPAGTPELRVRRPSRLRAAKGSDPIPNLRS